MHTHLEAYEVILYRSYYYAFDHRCLALGASKAEMRAMLAHDATQAVKCSMPRIDRERYARSLFTFSGNADICDKIADGKIYLSENEIAQGIVPNPDVVNNRNRKSLTDQSIQTGEGVFVIPRGMFKGVSKAEEKYIKPLFEPYQIERYVKAN